MILMPVSLLCSDMITAKDVESNLGKCSYLPLIRKGVRLNSSLIFKLKMHCIETIYVEMDGTEDIIVPDLIDHHLKSRALNHIEKLFNSYEKSGQTLTPKMFDETNRLSRQLVENALNQPDVLISLCNLKKHDDYTYIHSLCVSLLSIGIGISMQLDYNTLRDLSTSALLHDLGKVAIPNQILNKPSVLTPEEFSLVQTHPNKGESIILKRNSFVSFPILGGVKSHHEHYDGNGYPDGLQQDAIPLFAKIIALGDVYDALTSDRPYRKASQPHDAIEYIMGCANTHFDINIMQHFLKTVVAYPVGCIVILSDGRRAVVVKNYSANIMRPRVRLMDAHGVQTQEVDLFNNPKYLNLTITAVEAN